MYIQKQEKEIAREYTKALIGGDLKTIFDTHTQIQQDNIFDFTAIINAIQNASPADLQATLEDPDQDNESPLCLALNHFRDAFTDLSHSEKVFNPWHLLAAFEAYAYKFDQENPDYDKLDLFWNQVIGFVQRFSPAYDAQAFAFGLRNLVEDGCKSRGAPSFDFREGPVNFGDDWVYSFYPLSRARSGLGFNFAKEACPQNLAGWGALGIDVFKKFCEAKISRLGDLCLSSTQRFVQRLVRPR